MKTLKYILPIALLGTFAASCDDLFDPALENKNELEKMHKDADFAQGMLANAYILMPYQSVPESDLATDDAVSSDNSSNYVKMANGNWTSQNDPLSQWVSRNNAIQYINIMLENVDQVNWSADEHLQTLFVDLMRGDAYGMRALQLFYLVRAHAGLTADGEMLGVPLLLKYQDANADFNIPRNTLKECVAQIFDDIQKGMELLPDAYGDLTKNEDVPARYKSQGITAAEYSRAFGNHERGKMNATILRALKAQVALWAASDAYKDYTGVTMADAAAYASDVINMRQTPNQIVANGNTWYCNTDEIGGLEKGSNAPECIWQGGVEERLSHEESYYPPSLYGNGTCCPTQNLVDAFPMANGLPIGAAGSGYNASKPYENRDPRLALYIVYDGNSIGGATISTSNANANNNDGLNRKSPVSTRTGYYMRKLLRPDVSLTPGNQTKQKSYDARIRYTEIYLAYAEAANEAYGPTTAAPGMTLTPKQVIKLIRERAGICVGEEDQYLNQCAASKDAMRQLIRNERRIELCFENHRFYDLRRWKVALADLNAQANGMDVAAGYSVIPVETRKYQDYQYYGPIPYTEILKYDQLKQNKGW